MGCRSSFNQRLSTLATDHLRYLATNRRRPVGRLSARPARVSLFLGTRILTRRRPSSIGNGKTCATCESRRTRSRLVDCRRFLMSSQEPESDAKISRPILNRHIGAGMSRAQMTTFSTLKALSLADDHRKEFLLETQRSQLCFELLRSTGHHR